MHRCDILREDGDIYADLAWFARNSLFCHRPKIKPTIQLGETSTDGPLGSRRFRESVRQAVKDSRAFCAEHGSRGALRSRKSSEEFQRKADRAPDGKTPPDDELSAG